MKQYAGDRREVRRDCEIYGRKEIAQKFGRSDAWALRFLRSSAVGAVKIGNCYYITAEGLEEFFRTYSGKDFVI